MSLRGGYQIIDLKMKEFSSSLNNYYRFPELFEDVKNGNAKMIILSGLNLDGVKYRDYEILIYEVNEVDTPMYYQAILRRMWNTRDYKVITKYLNIYPDDRVNITIEENIYEILPDGSLSLTSTNAVQNKVITEKVNEIDILNAKQTSRINELNNGDYTHTVVSKNYDIGFIHRGVTSNLNTLVTFKKVGNIIQFNFDITGDSVYEIVASDGLNIGSIINTFNIIDRTIFGKEYEVIESIKLEMGYTDSGGNYISTSLCPILRNQTLYSRISPITLVANQNGASTVEWRDLFEGVATDYICSIKVTLLAYNDDVTSLGD